MSVSIKRIEKLLKEDTKGSKISIYIPTHPKTTSETLYQDTNRFKNALQETKRNPNYDAQELDKTMKSLEALHEDAEFWKHQDIGLAIFADKDGYEIFHLPYETTEATYLKDRFAISPLVVMHSIGTSYYVLDINLNNPRLLVSHDGSLVEVGVDDMPDSFQDEVEGDEYKRELQNKPAPRDSNDSNRFHGNSVEDEISKDIDEYLTEIANATSNFLKESDQPLLLVGEQSRIGNIRPKIKYDNLLAERVDGNYEKHTLQDLYKITIEEINKYDSQRRQKKIDELLSADSKNIVVGRREIAEAAEAGRVERIYVPAYRRTNDSVRSNAEQSIVLQMPEDVKDIKDIEAVIIDVLSQGGSVQAVEIGLHKEIQESMALCRY